MPKIRVELEVPDSAYCTTCEYGKYIASDYAICTLFGSTILKGEDILPKRCKKCKQAEIEK